MLQWKLAKYEKIGSIYGTEYLLKNNHKGWFPQKAAERASLYIVNYDPG